MAICMGGLDEGERRLRRASAVAEVDVVERATAVRLMAELAGYLSGCGDLPR